MHFNFIENFDYTPKAGLEYAQAYVPFQEMRELYTPIKGLKAGTVFPELYQPYCK